MWSQTWQVQPWKRQDSVSVPHITQRNSECLCVGACAYVRALLARALSLCVCISLACSLCACVAVAAAVVGVCACVRVCVCACVRVCARGGGGARCIGAERLTSYEAKALLHASWRPAAAHVSPARRSAHTHTHTHVRCILT